MNTDRALEFRVAVRHNTLEWFYTSWRKCQLGEATPADYGPNVTLDFLLEHARKYRVEQVNAQLNTIRKLQRDRTTNLVIDQMLFDLKELDIAPESAGLDTTMLATLRRHATDTE